MFASIPNYLDFFTEEEIHEGGVACLQILNEIISGYDRVSKEWEKLILKYAYNWGYFTWSSQLLFETQFARVEKIKVISSTYMAACGLQPGRKGSNENSNIGKIQSRIFIWVIRKRKKKYVLISMFSSSLQRRRRQCSRDALCRRELQADGQVCGCHDAGAQEPQLREIQCDHETGF